MAEDQEAPAEEVDGTEEGGAGGGKKKLFIIIGAVVLVLLLGVVAMMFMGGGDEEVTPAESAENTGTEAGSEDAEDAKEGESPEEEKEGDDSKEEGTEEGKEGEGDKATEATTPKTDENFGDTYTFKAFAVNLGNPLENHYIRLEMAIEYRGGEAQKAEIEKRVPQLRDAVISVTSRKTKEFLLGPDGKDQLRREVLIRLNRYMNKPIEAVYITDMMIE